MEVVSNGIYFINEGVVDLVYINKTKHQLVALDPGSYFGDISFIFQVKNQYHYIAKRNSKAKIYSL